MKAVLTSSLLAMIYRIGGAGATALTFIFVARSLPISEVGIYSISSAFIVVGRFLGPLGIDQLSIGMLGSIEPNSESYKRHMATVLQIVIQNSAIICVCAFAISAFLVPHNGLLRFVYIITSIIYFLMSISGILSIIYRITERNFLSFFPDSFMSPLITCAITAYLYIYGMMSLQATLLAVVMGCFFCVALQMYLMGHVKYRILSMKETLNYLRRSFQLFLIQASSFLQQRAILYIALGVGGTRSVAIIDTSLKFAMISTLATWAVGSLMAPKFVKLFRDKNTEEAQKCFNIGSFGAFVPAVGISVCFIVLGQFFLFHFFGERYVAAYIPTVIILISTAINAAGSLSSVVLMHNGFKELVLRQTAWAVALGAFGAASLGYFFGEIGIALGALISAIVRDVGLSIVLFRYSGLHPGALSPAGWVALLQQGAKAIGK